MIGDFKLPRGGHGGVQLGTVWAHKSCTDLPDEPLDSHSSSQQRFAKSGATIESRTAWGLRTIVGQAVHHLRAVFRFLVKLPALEVVALQMRARAIHSQSLDTRKMWSELSSKLEEAPLLHPLHGWKNSSIWSAWAHTCDDLVLRSWMSEASREVCFDSGQDTFA